MLTLGTELRQLQSWAPLYAFRKDPRKWENGDTAARMEVWCLVPRQLSQLVIQGTYLVSDTTI